MTLDVDGLRAEFPSLESGLAHFDGPGGTQTPAVVGATMAATLTAPLSNRGRSVSSERNSEDAVHAFRSAYADLLGVPAEGIVYGRSATQIGYDFSRHLAKTWQPGDEVLLSRIDHDANVRPWVQAASAAGASVRWLDVDPDTADLNLTRLDDLINERTRLVAVTGASNLLGTKPPVARIADAAHRAGALVYVDGVHYAAHAVVDPETSGADFFVCSPYKFFGPHCAVLAASPELLDTIRPDKLLPSTDAVPERFEFGTLPYEIMAGATAAVDFLAGLGSGSSRRERLHGAHTLISAHEYALRSRIETAVAAWGERVTLHSRAADRTPTLLLTFAGRKGADAAAFLAERDVLAPAGTFYAYEPARALGLPDGGLRIGVAAYTSDSDVDRLLDGLTRFLG